MNHDPKPSAEDVAVAEHIGGNHFYLMPMHRRAAIERDIALALARVRGEEREACAWIVDAEEINQSANIERAVTARRIAAAIRARESAAALGYGKP